MASTVGVIFSSINDENIPELTRIRSMGSVPYGGKYRLIDFPLSNMVNSGITTVGVITKQNYQSLMDHLGSGKNWDLARKEGGVILLPPYSDESETLYRGRLEALKGVTAFLKKCKQDYVLLSDSDSVYRLDYGKVVSFHEKKKADITMVYHEHKVSRSRYYMTFLTDKNDKIVEININPSMYNSENSNFIEKNYINVMVARTSFLLNLIQNAIQRGYNSFGRDILIPGVKYMNIYGYKMEGYYANIDSLVAYFNSNFDLLNKDIRDELFGARDIYTKVNDSAPAKFTNNAVVKNSLIADGCIIDGVVENSILFRGVKIAKGTVVKNCILMTESYVGQNSNLSYIVSDKNSIVRDNRTLAGCEIQPYFIGKGAII